MIAISISQENLQFLKPAKTASIAYEDRKIILIRAHILGQNVVGEVAPLPHLSKETIQDCLDFLEIQDGIPEKKQQEWLSEAPSSVRFAIEGMLLESSLRGKPKYDETIKINGLVWMSDFEQMWQELEEKVANGFDCIKIKVGQHDFDAECRFLEKIRLKYPHNIQIRLDANGSMHIDDALYKLKDLNKYTIHSIEQPIKANQWDAMQEICAKSKIKIALDEELINYSGNKTDLLKHIKPAFLVLKPTLLNGFCNCDLWIKEAQKNNIDWWATSALESNIGLYQIALWVNKYRPDLPQGLGTGSLFQKNFTRPFVFVKDQLNWISN